MENELKVLLESHHCTDIDDLTKQIIELVIPKIAEAIEQTKWQLKEITAAKTRNIEGADKQIMLKIGELQLAVCDTVIENILSNFTV